MSDTNSITISSTPKLADALAKAQGQIQSAKKTSENPAFSRANKKSTYADIAEVIEVIQKPACDNGLSVIFDFKGGPDAMFIRYKLMHSSGEFILGDWLPMFLRDKTLHGFGASNTFMRRQLLKAIYQIPEEDDDGNSQSGDETEKPKDPAKKPAAAKAPPPKPKDSADFLMPFGDTTKGKPLKSLNEETLRNILIYCKNKMTEQIPEKDLAIFKNVHAQIVDFLKTMGVEV